MTKTQMTKTGWQDMELKTYEVIYDKPLSFSLEEFGKKWIGGDI